MGFSTLFGSKTITTDSKLPGNTLMSSDVEQQSHDRYRHLCREPGEVVVRSRPALRLAILSFVITVVCFLIVAATAVVVVVRSHVAARQESEEQTCVPCLQLTPDPTSEVKSMLLETLDVHVEADEEICCARTRSQYAAVFKLVSSPLDLSNYPANGMLHMLYSCSNALFSGVYMLSSALIT